MLIEKNVNGDTEIELHLYSLVRIFWNKTKMIMALYFAFTMILY